MQNLLDKSKETKNDLTDRQTDRQTEELLSKEQGQYLRGLFASLILVCHIYGMLSSRVDTTSLLLNPVFFYPLFGLGYISVAVFLFITGYGLVQQYNRRGIDYINDFPRNRILPFYIKYVILILLYIVFYTLCKVPGNKVSALVIIKSFLFGGTIVSKGWYLQASLIIYLCFFAIFRLVKSRRWLWVITATLIYIIICILLGLPTTWYECALLPMFGGLCGSIDVKPQKNWLCIIVAGMLFCILFLLGIKSFFGEPIRILCKILSTVVFVWFVLSLINKNVHPLRRIFCWLGSISFEIYVLQGMVMEFFEYGFRIENHLLYCIAVVAITIIISILTHPAFNAIDGKLKKNRAS